MKSITKAPVRSRGFHKSYDIAINKINLSYYTNPQNTSGTCLLWENLYPTNPLVMFLNVKSVELAWGAYLPKDAETDLTDLESKDRARIPSPSNCLCFWAVGGGVC